MTQNASFNDELKQLQKAFWDNVGANFVHSSKIISDEHNSIDPQQSVIFKQWLTDVDKCWHDNIEITSTEIDDLYKKISSSSRFFVNFTESVSSKKQGDISHDLFERILEGYKSESSNKQSNDEDTTNQTESNTFNSSDNTDTSSESTDNFEDINTFWKLPSAIIKNQQQSFETVSTLFEDAAKNLEFSAAVKAYLIALQKYQLVFFNLFKESAIQSVETLKNKSDKLESPKQIMSVCLEVLEVNYMLLISEEGYSQVYADVVNSWMLMLSKSNKSFADFIQSTNSSDHLNPDA